MRNRRKKKRVKDKTGERRKIQRRGSRRRESASVA